MATDDDEESHLIDGDVCEGATSAEDNRARNHTCLEIILNQLAKKYFKMIIMMIVMMVIVDPAIMLA